MAIVCIASPSGSPDGRQPDPPSRARLPQRPRGRAPPLGLRPRASDACAGR